MPRKHWKIRSAKTRVSDVTREFFETGSRPDGHLATFTLLGDPAQLRAVWAATRSAILGDWLQAHPCARPWVWWDLEAHEPRRRTGGVGAPLHAVLAVDPRYAWQIPRHWVTTDHATVFGVGPAVDPANPPRHESQAAYLDRLGLLSPAEKQYLSTHPELRADEILQR